MTEVKITAEVMQVLETEIEMMFAPEIGACDKEWWCETYEEAIAYVMEELNTIDEQFAEKIVKLILKI